MGGAVCSSEIAASDQQPLVIECGYKHRPKVPPIGGQDFKGFFVLEEIKSSLLLQIVIIDALFVDTSCIYNIGKLFKLE